MKIKTVCLTLLFLVVISTKVTAIKPVLNVKDYGAVGDGITDDGPAIDAAFAEATNFKGNAIIAFEKKSYYIGEKITTWSYFNLENLDSMIVDGNGAELLFKRTNQPFSFINCTNITVRNLFVDFIEPTYAQGKVIAKNTTANTIDVLIQDGYPLPPIGTSVSGGGGLHGQVFEPTEYFRKKNIDQDFFYCASITKIADKTYRFLMDSPNYVQVPLIAVNDRITYGIGTLHLDAIVKAKKTGKSGAAIYLRECSNMLFEDFTLYGSFTMGFNINNSNGLNTLRRVSIKRKPGTDRLLALPSDGVHTDNNRGGIIVEDCFLESCADDMLSLHSKEEEIIAKINDTTFELQSTDLATIFNITKANDELMFIDRTSKTVLGNAIVQSVTANIEKFTSTVVLDRAISNLDVGITAFNLSSATPGTVIKNNTFNITRRFAMFLRLIGATIDNNTVNGFGGSKGIELLDETNTGPFSRNYSITNNTISNLNNVSISVGSSFPCTKDLDVAGNFIIQGNTINCNNPTAISLRNTSDVLLKNNTIVMGQNNIGTVRNAITVTNSKNVTIDGLTLTDKRASAPSNTAMMFTDCNQESISISNLTFSLYGSMSNYLFVNNLTTFYIRPIGDTNSWTKLSGILPTQIITSNSPAITGANTYYFAKGTYSTSGIVITTGKIIGGFKGDETVIDLSARALSDKDGNGMVEPWEFTNETIINGNASFLGTGSTNRLLTVTGGEVNGFTLQNQYLNSDVNFGTIILGQVTSAPTNSDNIFSAAGKLEACTIRKIKAFKAPIMLTNKLSLIDNCLIEECVSASTIGTAAVFMNLLGGKVSNSVLRNNYNAGSSGGAIYANSLTSTDMNAIVENCVLYNNTAKFGAAIRGEAKTDKLGIQIVNCTAANNMSTTATVASVDLISGGLIVNSIVLDDTQNEIRANTSNHYVANNAFGALGLGAGVTAYPNTDMISGKTIADFGFTSPTTFQGTIITGDANFDQTKYDEIRHANYKINQPNSIGLSLSGLKELPSSYLVGGTGAPILLTANIPALDISGVTRPISASGNVSLGAYQYNNLTDLTSEMRPSVSIYPTIEGIRICGADGHRVNLYSISGQLVKSTIGMSDNLKFSVVKGFYIVTVGSNNTKILVK